MSERYYIWMPCTIENSGFSSERRFEVDLPASGGRIVGAAYIEHFRDADHKELPEGQPPYGKVVKGFVQCRVVKQDRDRASIEFPGTDIFHVPQEALAGYCKK